MANVRKRATAKRGHHPLPLTMRRALAEAPIRRSISTALDFTPKDVYATDGMIAFTKEQKHRFDPDSYFTLRLGQQGTLATMGCSPGEYDPRTGRCLTGRARIQRILVPKARVQRALTAKPYAVSPAGVVAVNPLEPTREQIIGYVIHNLGWTRDMIEGATGAIKEHVQRILDQAKRELMQMPDPNWWKSFEWAYKRHYDPRFANPPRWLSSGWVLGEYPVAVYDPYGNIKKEMVKGYAKGGLIIHPNYYSHRKYGKGYVITHQKTGEVITKTKTYKDAGAVADMLIERFSDLLQMGEELRTHPRVHEIRAFLGELAPRCLPNPLLLTVYNPLTKREAKCITQEVLGQESRIKQYLDMGASGIYGAWRSLGSIEGSARALAAGKQLSQAYIARSIAETQWPAIQTATMAHEIDSMLAALPVAFISQAMIGPQIFEFYKVAKPAKGQPRWIVIEAAGTPYPKWHRVYSIKEAPQEWRRYLRMKPWKYKSATGKAIFPTTVPEFPGSAWNRPRSMMPPVPSMFAGRRSRANPSTAFPWHKGQKIPTAEFREWARMNRPDLLPRFEQTVEDYKRFHLGAEPETVTYDELPIGGEEILPLEYFYSAGKSEEERYTPPESSGKAPHRYVHKYETQPEVLVGGGGRLVIKPLRGTARVTDWFHG